MIEDRALWRPWAWYCPLLALAGWACTVPAAKALLLDLNAALRCHDSAGVPAYALLLAATGLALDLAAVLWSIRQLAAVVRRRAPLCRRGLALAALLAVTVLGCWYQWPVVQLAHEFLGPQQHCTG